MLEKQRRMRIDDKGIGGVLQGPPLAVPPNQREYSWTEKEVTDLFEDLQKAIDADQPSYFLGTIALTGPDPSKPEVTDGQQRLATITILLAAMRDYFHYQGNTFAVASLEQGYLTVPDQEEQRFVPRLTLNVDDRDFFAKQVATKPDNVERQENPSRSSHKRISKAIELANKRVKLITEGYTKKTDKAKRLNHWIQFITHNAVVIILELPSSTNAFQMFETLNDRGLRTTQVDIVKNFLFKKAEGEMPTIQPKWSRLMTTLESMDGEEVPLTFLRHFVITKCGMTRAGEVYNKVEEIVSGKRRAVEIVGEMEETANDYAAITAPDHTKWNAYPHGIRNSIRTMQYLKVVNTKPLMLSAARHFSPKDAEKAFRLFVNWTVRFLVVGGGRSGSLEESYAEAAHEISIKNIKDAKGLAIKLQPSIPGDALFKEAFATAVVSKSSLVRYYLRALELSQKGMPEPEWIPNEDASEITLEHVLPENPGPNWSHVNPDLASALYTRLGNLALLQASKNNALENKPFSDKKVALQRSAFVLTSQIANYDSWGPVEINDRQTKLAGLAVKTWPLDVK